MPAGTIQTVVVCVAATSATTTQQAVCPRVGTQYFRPTTVQGYVLNPDQQAMTDAAFGSFDYGYASGLWALAFSSVVALYLVSHGIGTVLAFIRRG